MASVIVVGTNSFVTAAEATTYFTTRWGADAWATLSEAQKDAALITAYNQLKNSGAFEFPSEVSTQMKMGQFEQALFLVIHGADALARGGLIAQGVEQSQISKETYDSEMRGRIALCPEAYELLKDYYVRSEGNFVLYLERKDDDVV